MRREEGSALEDSECIGSVLAGDGNAYGELVARYQGAVFRVCLKIAGSRNAAEDLAQEAFIKAYDALPGFRQDASFSTWLYRIAVRTCLDWRRAEERDRRRRRVYDEGMGGTSATPEQTVIARESAVAVLSLVEGLHEPYRTVVKLFYLKNRSYQEIARETGSSVKTVESQLYRARRMMREKGEGLR